MFTGIVEQMGEVSAISKTEAGLRISLNARGLDDLEVGDSISVNGVCLTAVTVDDSLVAVDVIPETLDRSSLGSAEIGSRVNLERAMPASGRFDGHIVQGHVDGMASVKSIDRDENDGVHMTFDLDAGLSRYVVEKGSITVDGVSLTVAAVGDGAFGVALIPHTLEVTTLGLRSVGDVVNLEVDVVAKYVESIVESR